jgi:hypothetical protein
MSLVLAMLPTPWELERCIHRLPAEKRAQLRWGPERFRQILDRLLVGEVTPEVIHQATADCVRVIVESAEEILMALMGVPDDEPFGPDPTPSLDDRLMTCFQGLPAAAGLEWTLGVLRNFGELHQSNKMSSEEKKAFFGSIDASNVEEIEEMVRSPSMAHLRAQIILFALLQAAEQGIAPDRLEQLAGTAHREAARKVELMAAQGIDLDPRSNLTPEQRFEKVRQSHPLF